MATKIRLEIIKCSDPTLFENVVSDFYNTRTVIECKFQRNLYYKGIGSSAGKTPGSPPLTAENKLEESYVAFIVYKERK